MSRLFEELDYQPTPIGPVSLRRRRLLHLDRDVVEVMLGEEHLMSSLFTEGERALATLGLAAAQGEKLAVVVGGLGLGYTAAAALDDTRVGELLVVEYLAPVIDWHRRGLVPLGERLCGDARCRFVHADFFAAARAAPPTFDPAEPGRRFDAILLDVDHAPDRLLNPTHGDVYTAEGLARLTEALKPGGVFALWSDDRPEPEFLGRLRAAFTSVAAEVVEFENPVTGGASTCTVYVAKAG